MGPAEEIGLSTKGVPMQIRKRTLAAILAVAFTVGVLWFTNRDVSPDLITWEDVQAEAKSGGYRIITTGDLARLHQKDPDSIFLVDTRMAWEFRIGHIKGAINFPMEPTWWARWRGASALEALLGPDKNRIIVFYSDGFA